MSSISNSNIARFGSVSQERGARSAVQSTQQGSLRSGSSATCRPTDGRPQDPNTPPPNECYSVPKAALSPSTTPLTFQNLAQHAQATAQLGGDSTVDYNHRVQAIHNTLHQLGFTLPTDAVAELAKKFDGMTSIERFLAQEGYWVPHVSRDGHEYHAGNTVRQGKYRHE